MKARKLTLNVLLYEKGDRVQTSKGKATIRKNEVEPCSVEDAVNGQLLISYDPDDYGHICNMDEILIKKSEVKSLFKC